MKSLNNKITLLTIFDSIITEGLSPNQYYLLQCLNENITAPSVNLHQDLRHLVSNEWIKDETSAKGPLYILQPKAKSLISKIDSFVGIHVKKALSHSMGADFETNAEKYNNIFPKIRLGSNKAARSPIKEIIIAFKWFFENYEYSWETIHEAAEVYIETERSKNFKFTRTSKYFIRKQDTDKSWSSDLASYCELVESGEDFDKPKHIEKVF